MLARLNSRPTPDGVRVYLYYGELAPGPRRTVRGFTGSLIGGAATYGPGDGVVLVASVLGQSINGTGEIAGLTRRIVLTVNLGSVLHVFLFPKAASLVASAMQDGFQTSLASASTPDAMVRAPLVSALVHTPTGASFRFEFIDSAIGQNRVSVFTPGDDAHEVTKAAASWEEQLARVRAWLEQVPRAR